MPPRVDSRDVLDPNGRTRCPFAARVVGRYRRVGPNAWDDYELSPAKVETVQVSAGIKVQVEEHGARFRLRRRGEVLVAEWLPTPQERAAMDGLGRDPRAHFIEACIADFASPPGIGLAAVIAKKLREDE